MEVGPGITSYRILRLVGATALFLFWMGATRGSASPVGPLYGIEYVERNSYPGNDIAPFAAGYSTHEGSYSTGTVMSMDTARFLGKAYPDDRAYLQGVVTPDVSMLGVPIEPLSGDGGTWAMTLNAYGHVVGISTPVGRGAWWDRWTHSPQSTHAFFYSVDSGTVALNTLNGGFGLPMGINNSDQIVGESYTSDGSIHGFITRPGAAAVDLNDVIAPGSGYTIVAGVAIDSRGNIRAMGKDAAGMNRFMMLYPIAGIDPNFPALQDQAPGQDPPPVHTEPPPNVPEPTTLVVLAVAGLGCVARRRWSSASRG